MTTMDLDNKSWELCDKTLESLRKKALSPLPNNYQTEFNELLKSHASEEFLYETINQQNNSDDINKYLEIAHLALQSFMQSNQEIRDVMHEHAVRMTPPPGYENDYLSKHCAIIVDNLAQLDTEMSNALLKANTKIAQLSTKIELLTEENTIDYLTKFFNRKELFKDLVSISSNLHKDIEELDYYLLMIDLDDFKTINDSNSHMAGDKVLLFVAKTIASLIRNTDKAYRYGEDEFILVLNRCTLNVAQTIAEKIRANIEKAHLFYENKEINITVSIGISKLSGKEFESSLLRADKALYAAKKQNKNQVYTLSQDI